MKKIKEGWKAPIETFVSKTKLKQEIIEINKEAMENLGRKDYEKCFKGIDKANHLIEFYFKDKRQEIWKMDEVEISNLIYRYQLLSITYNNCACLYKYRNKLMFAIKCLYQALKADKDLIRLLEKLSQIKESNKISEADNSKELYEIMQMNDNYKFNFANTYLNICAVLSLMNNHEKALHMAQKAIEMITQESNSKYFALDNFLNDLIGDDKHILKSSTRSLIITLCAAYYNKTLEIDYMNDAKFLNKEYLSMASDSINCAVECLSRLL